MEINKKLDDYGLSLNIIRLRQEYIERNNMGMKEENASVDIMYQKVKLKENVHRIVKEVIMQAPINYTTSLSILEDADYMTKIQDKILQIIMLDKEHNDDGGGTTSKPKVIKDENVSSIASQHLNQIVSKYLKEFNNKK